MMTMFTRLFGRQGRSAQSLGFIEAQRMVLDYARYLQDYPPMPGRIIDESELPHPKAALKEAMVMCISNSDDERLEEHLRHGYLMLSAFQRGVGEQAIGTDFAALDLGADILDIATRIEGDAGRARSWQQAVQRELQQLQDELRLLELALGEPERMPAA